jgi:hypothetical protein
VMFKCVFRVSVPNAMDLRRSRFPPSGPNPPNSIPLMPRDELFPLDTDSSASARGRTDASDAIATDARNVRDMTNRRGLFGKEGTRLPSLRKRNRLVSGVYGKRTFDAPHFETSSQTLPPAPEGDASLSHTKVLHLNPIEPSWQGRRDVKPFVGGIRSQPQQHL